MTTVLGVATFSGASSLPLFVAIERGHFEAHGLDVRMTTVKSSDQLMNGLLDGTFQIVHSAPDNFIAWRDRTGRDVLAWIGGAGGPLALVGAPDVPDAASLRGRSVAVDSPESGFVSTLRLILRAAGVGEDEIRLEALGSTQLRLKSLLAGETSASMLSLPWSLVATDAGCHVIGEQADVIPRLQGSCGASLEGWLEANREVADEYFRALVGALTDLYTDAMPADDVRRLLRERYEVEDAHAEVVRRAFVDPVRGWPPSGLIDAEGMEAVCRLRTDAGRPPRAPADSYYTLEPYRRLFGFEAATATSGAGAR
jgi:ABC-type nitrate/sulfonate/bicarbonate transport system substrate-binding protein